MSVIFTPIDTVELGKELVELGRDGRVGCSIDMGLCDGHRVFASRLTDCIFSSDGITLCFDSSSESIPTERTTALELLAQCRDKLRNEYMACKNNDCRCREGFGLCNQCKESAIELCEQIDDILGS